MEANHRPVASSFKLEVGAAILTIHMGEAITNYYDCHYKTCNSQNSASLPSS